MMKVLANNVKNEQEDPQTSALNIKIIVKHDDDVQVQFISSFWGRHLSGFRLAFWRGVRV